MLVRTATSMTITTIPLAITGVFGGGPAASGSSTPKNERTFKKWPNRLADTHKRLAGKASEALFLSWEVLLVLF